MIYTLIRWTCLIVIGYLLYLPTATIWARFGPSILPANLKPHAVLIGYAFCAIIVYFGATGIFDILASLYNRITRD